MTVNEDCKNADWRMKTDEWRMKSDEWILKNEEREEMIRMKRSQYKSYKSEIFLVNVLCEWHLQNKANVKAKSNWNINNLTFT